jgi:hypothetical protein
VAAWAARRQQRVARPERRRLTEAGAKLGGTLVNIPLMAGFDL